MNALARHYVGQGDACGQHSHPHFTIFRLGSHQIDEINAPTREGQSVKKHTNGNAPSMKLRLRRRFMIRRGTFHSADELEQAIYQWLANWNGSPAPFVWKASANVILDKVRRCKELTKTGD
jgi:hypothetical protein